MGAVLHSAVAYGYPNSMEGVEKFTQAYDELQRSDSRGEELQAAAKERWGLLFSRGLGMDVEEEDIPLTKAQEIVRQQCNDMQKESFLEQVNLKTLWCAKPRIYPFLSLSLARVGTIQICADKTECDSAAVADDQGGDRAASCAGKAASRYDRGGSKDEDAGGCFTDVNAAPDGSVRKPRL